MDRRQASMVVAAALSALFGCAGWSPFGRLMATDTRKIKGGVWITKYVYENGTVGYQRTGEPMVYDNSLESYFTAQESAVGTARSAAAVEREKLVPPAPAQQAPSPPATSPLPAGPKVDLPTQTYRPPSGHPY